MATKKTVKAAPDEVKEEVKIDPAGEAKSKKKYVPSGGPFAPRRDGPFVPATRFEEFLFAIATADPDEYDPENRLETLLTGIAFALYDRATWGDLDGFLLPDYSGASVGATLKIGSDGFPEWT